MLCRLISPTYQYIGSNRSEPQNQPDIHSDSLRQDSRNHTGTLDRRRIHRHQHTKYHLDPSDIQVDRCTGSFQEHSGTFQSAGKATPSQRIHQHLPHMQTKKNKLTKGNALQILLTIGAATGGERGSAPLFGSGFVVRFVQSSKLVSS